MSVWGSPASTCCNIRALAWRRQLVLEELVAYDADVLCLQEVDERAFTDYLQPHLRHLGTPPPAVRAW
jgi:mRNA deadenylase 3'-5' endonuclease subunit Ccr4